MNNSPAELIARSVLYEGYILYPYRASAMKNRQRWTFGGLAPRADTEAASLRTECLVRGSADAIVSAQLRFLHLFQRARGTLPPWQEATEREIPVPAVRLGELIATPQLEAFTFDASRSVEPDPRGETQRTQHAIEGSIELSGEQVGEGVFRVAVRVVNLTNCDAKITRDELALRTLTSAHVALRVSGGEFVSLTDPPEELRALADACRNEGVWPVLVGAPGTRGEMLASPIILPDYPRVAPESPGDFFDGTEIDELLALRVLTLTENEKHELAESDPRAKAILERVETLSADRMRNLHGAVRSPRPRPGDRVRLRPRGRADAFDILLAGKTATIVSVEVDFEGTTYFAVTVNDDPGGDLGESGKIAHRFFFRPDEVELLAGGGVP